MKVWPAVLAALAAPAILAGIALGAAPGTNVLVSRPGGFGALATPTTNDSFTTGLGINELGGGSPRTVADADAHRYVAFASDADGLSDADSNTVTNIYVRDRTLNTTILVSRADGPGGEGANGGSSEPSISADGRYVAFASTATNLAQGAGGSANHIYVRDILNGQTRLIDRADGADGAIANDGSSSPSITVKNNQPVVAFASAATNLDGAIQGPTQIYVRDESTDDTEMVSREDGSTSASGNNVSGHPSIASDANHVAFESNSSDLSPTLDDNGVTDIYERTLSTNDTRAVSTSGGAIGDGTSTQPSISSDGNEVAFTSTATNLNNIVDTDPEADVYVRSFSPNVTLVVSRESGDTNVDANAAASEPSITDGGSAVVYASSANNLVAGDTNGAKDVFMRTAATVPASGVTSRISQPDGSTQADGHSSAPSIARNPSSMLGNTTVAFQTSADNMGADDENDFQQVYTRGAGPIVGQHVAAYISRPSGSGAFRSGVNFSALRPQVRSTDNTSAMSEDGRYTVFLSAEDDLSSEDDNRFLNIFRRDNRTGETVLVSRANGAAGAAANGTSAPSAGPSASLADPSAGPAISGDGNRVVFASSASNLVADDGNGVPDVFVRDVAAGTTVMASRDGAGAPLLMASGDPAISGNGNRVAFVTLQPIDGSDANGLADIYLRDLAAGTTVLVSRKGAAGPPGAVNSFSPAVDADGSHVAFATNVTDLDAANVTDANGDSDVAVHTVGQGTKYVSVALAGGATGSDDSTTPAISADGNRIAFMSFATNVGTGLDLNGGEQDIFVRDMAAGTAVLASRTAGANGVSGNSGSGRPSISADGTRVAFESGATDLVPGDSNGAFDVFIRDLSAETIERVSAGSTDRSEAPSISGDGNCLAFDTRSDDLVPMPPGTDFVRVVARALRGDCPFGPADAASGDTEPPIISKVSIKPKRFLAGKKLRKMTKKRPAVGGRLRYTLSEDAGVTVRIDAKLKGGRVKGRCVKPRPKNRKRRRCNRFVKKQTLRQSGKLGANRLNITGRVRRRNLKPGPYRITITATDEARNVSAPKRVSFKILKPKRARR